MKYKEKTVEEVVVKFPPKLMDDVNSLNLKERERDKALQFIKMVETRSIRKYGIPTGLVPIPNTLIKKMYSSRYEFLKDLKSKGVIKCNEYYSVVKGVCKGYSIEGEYYINSGGDISRVLCVILCRILKKKANSYEERFLEDYNKLLINKELLEFYLDQRISRLKEEKLVMNQDVVNIMGRVIFLDNPNAPEDRNLVHLKKKLEGTGLNLIKHKKLFYVGTEEQFRTLRIAAVMSSTTDLIDKLSTKKYWANLCEKNGRFDTIISSTHNYLMEQIMKDNDLASIDLCNSQFAFLAHLLPDDRQYDFFKQLCGDGQLYAYMDNEARNRGFKFSKVDAITTLFMDAKLDTLFKQFMEELFPLEMAWVKRFKLKKSNVELALTLQKLESDMFIRDLYVDLKNRGLFCLTKHDSFLVKKSDAKLVRSIINDYFCRVNFKGTLKTT